MVATCPYTADYHEIFPEPREPEIYRHQRRSKVEALLTQTFLKRRYVTQIMLKLMSCEAVAMLINQSKTTTELFDSCRKLRHEIIRTMATQKIGTPGPVQ